MKTPIFQKLIIMYISVLFLGFTVAGIMLYYFLGNFVIEEKVKALTSSGDKISNFLNIYGDDPYARNLFNDLLIYEGENTNSMIWIVSKSGELLWYSEETLSRFRILGKLNNENGKLFLPDVKQYNKVMVNTGDTIVDKGDLYGLFDKTSYPWLTVQKPIIKEGEVKAAIFLNTPIPEVKKAQTSVFKLFLYTSILSDQFI